MWGSNSSDEEPVEKKSKEVANRLPRGTKETVKTLPKKFNKKFTVPVISSDEDIETNHPSTYAYHKDDFFFNV